MKKKTLTRILGLAALCCASPSASSAQSLDKTPAPRDFYREAKALFTQRAYAAALSPLQAYLRQAGDEPRSAAGLSRRAEAEYMLACAAYELGDPRAADILRSSPPPVSSTGTMPPPSTPSPVPAWSGSPRTSATT